MKGFEVLGEIREVEVIAVGHSIRDLPRLRKIYGRGRWRKLKGVAHVRLKSARPYRRIALVRGAWFW